MLRLASLLVGLPVPAWAQSDMVAAPPVTESPLQVLQYLSYLVAFVAILLFLSGGLYVVLSIGKPDRMENGRRIFVRSIKGMALVISLYALVRLGMYYWS